MLYFKGSNDNFLDGKKKVYGTFLQEAHTKNVSIEIKEMIIEKKKNSRSNHK